MPTEDALMRTRQVLASPRRVELLRLLGEHHDAMSVNEAADLLGLHPNTVRIHLDRLAEVGLIEAVIERRSEPGRPRTLYRATGHPPVDESADPDAYRVLATLLADGLSQSDDPGGAAMAAGERWIEAIAGHDWPARPASAEAAATELVDLLDGLGFSPESDLDHDAILLRRCPFAEVARDHRTVVCGIHLGMVRRTLERLDSPLRATGLEPFVNDDPLLCRIHLTTDPVDEHAGPKPLPMLVTTHTSPTPRRNA